MNEGIRVLKFGGSSVGEPSVMRRAAMVATAALSRDGRPGSGPGVVVVSALGGVTRALVEIATLAYAGSSTSAGEAVARLEARHTDFLRELALPPSEHEVASTALNHLLDSLRNQLLDVQMERSQFEDSVLAHGELLASQLFWSVLRSLGVRCRWIDARQVLRTDDHFRSAAPDLAVSRTLAQLHIRPLLESGHSVVVPGFIGATADGRSTTMGFEASDLTATVLGSSLDAREVQIWTDVSGVLSADPRTVPEAYPLPHLHYDSARELALLGATVLHPDTMRPARGQRIPVRVMNCSRPGDAGTLIDGNQPVGRDSGRYGATSRRGQSVLSVATTVDMADAVLAFLRTLATRKGIPNALLSVHADDAADPGAEAASVVAVTATAGQARELAEAAARFGDTKVADGWSVVSLVACADEVPAWPAPEIEPYRWDGLHRSRSVLVPDEARDRTLIAVHAWIEERMFATASEAR